MEERHRSEPPTNLTFKIKSYINNLNANAANIILAAKTKTKAIIDHNNLRNYNFGFIY